MNPVQVTHKLLYNISRQNSNDGRVKVTSRSSFSAPQSVRDNSSVDTADSSDSEQLEQRNIIWKFLPYFVGGIEVKKLTWQDFKGIPEENLKWLAYTYWQLNYQYSVERLQLTTMKTQYTLKVRIQANFKEKSWVRKKSRWLLNHQTGHYVIGCITALQFKQRACQKSWTENYSMQIKELFRETHEEYLVLQERYDQETQHGQDQEQQDTWDQDLVKRLQEYKEFFDKGEINLNKCQEVRKAILSTYLASKGQQNEETPVNKLTTARSNNFKLPPRYIPPIKKPTIQN